MPVICERCKKRDAKNFVCQIIDGAQKNLSLCDECFRADQTLSDDVPTFDGTERCYYCQVPAKTARANDEAEQRVRGQRFHFTCVRCSQLYIQSILPAMAAIPADLSAEAQMSAYVDAVSASDRLVCATVRKSQA